MRKPWDKEKKVTIILDVRTVIFFVDKGMDKCPNLNCLGKIEYGMETCPHCCTNFRWFDEPSPKGWA